MIETASERGCMHRHMHAGVCMRHTTGACWHTGISCDGSGHLHGALLHSLSHMRMLVSPCSGRDVSPPYGGRRGSPTYRDDDRRLPYDDNGSRCVDHGPGDEGHKGGTCLESPCYMPMQGTPLQNRGQLQICLDPWLPLVPTSALCTCNCHFLTSACPCCVQGA